MTAQQTQPRLTIIPCDLADANAFVRRYHRHHGESGGHKFSLAVMDDAWRVRGVAIVGRPVNRNSDDGFTAEVKRVATDGCPNACSALYGAAWRAARAMGYRRMLSYILEHEPGTSLRAAGWRLDGHSRGSFWHIGKFDTLTCPTGAKQRWEVGDTPPFPSAPIWPKDERRPQLSLFEEVSA